jgi:hypothetical protein
VSDGSLPEPYNAERLRAELVKVLTEKRRGWPGLVEAAALAAADELDYVLRRACRAEEIIQKQRAAAPRTHDGRPHDWPMRDLEGSAIRVLAAYGVPIRVYRDGIAARVIARLQAPLVGNEPAQEPVDAVRRGIQRVRALHRWAEILETTGQPPPLVERPPRRPRRRAARSAVPRRRR